MVADLFLILKLSKNKSAPYSNHKRSTDMPEVLLENIVKKYDSDHVAVNDFNLKINDREFIVFVRTTGCVKSTTLTIIASLEEIKSRVENAAYILGLTNFLSRKPKELSGGQRQRVALGRAIVRDAKVFLMDEPLSNLDAKLRVQMRAEIQKLHHRLGTTSIYVT